MLRRYRKEQTERRLALGVAWKELDLVMDAGDGSPLDPNRLGQIYRGAAKRARVSGFRFHDLRHYFVTEAVKAGLDAATVSRMAGHATVAFTLDRYFHPSSETAAPLAGAVDAALGIAFNAL
jgi:integrase